MRKSAYQYKSASPSPHSIMPNTAIPSDTPARARRLRRLFVLGISMVFLLTACFAAYVGWLGFASLSARDRVIHIPAISGPAEVLWDAHGIPHIFAETLDDATAVLGFVHAQDRLWQMDIRRRTARGRVAEVIGRSGLSWDRRVRTLGLAELAEMEYAALPEAPRRAFDAYAAGVNAWLGANEDPLPPEFLVLGYDFELWKPVDGLLWTKLIALQLAGNYTQEWLRQELAAVLPLARVRELWPTHNDALPSVGERSPMRTSPSFRRPVNGNEPDERGASNGWVVSGKRTETGFPLLANDPHLTLTTPVVWYLVHIETPEHTLIGASTPGFPFIVIGQNRDVAWGITNTGSDLEDLFVEHVVPGKPGHYATPGGPRAFDVRRERIAVKDEGEEELVIRSTRHGPVVSDLFTSPAEGTAETEAASRAPVLALSATYLQPDDRTAEAAYAINRVRASDAFVAALRNFHSPQVNVLFADRAGNIGLIAPGRVPIRRGPPGWMPRPGWSGDADWEGWIPFAELPRVINPAKGYVVNANNRLTGPDYAYDLGVDWQASFRAERIDSLLSAETSVSLETMREISLDAVSKMARTLSPTLLAETASTPETAPILTALGAWDGTMALDKPEPLIFLAWLREINRALFADELGELYRRYGRLRPLVVRRTLTESRHWCDDITTASEETCPDQLALALHRALEKLRVAEGDDWATWKWGNVHVARFVHPFLDRYPTIADRLAAARSLPGGPYTINRGGIPGGASGSFARVHGSGLRAFFDLGNARRSEFVIAGGQSGHPLSRHAFSLLDAWAEGASIRLIQDRETLQQAGHDRLILRP